MMTCLSYHQRLDAFLGLANYRSCHCPILGGEISNDPFESLSGTDGGTLSFDMVSIASL